MVSKNSQFLNLEVSESFFSWLSPWVLHLCSNFVFEISCMLAVWENFLQDSFGIMDNVFHLWELCSRTNMFCNHIVVCVSVMYYLLSD